MMNFNLRDIYALNLSEDVFIDGISDNSNNLKTNYAFFAIPGTKFDGHNFIAQAIKNGAKVIFHQYDIEINPDIVYIKSDNIRKTLALVAHYFYHPQPEYIVGVTGTNGKTSVANFYRQIADLIHQNSASIGTIGAIANGKILPDYVNLTTPDIINLNQTLHQFKTQHIDYVALEASSHGIMQQRLNYIDFKAIAFTNFSQDHLDYHLTMDNYLQAKIKIFTDVMPKNRYAILNSDIEEFELIKNSCLAYGHKIIDYGKKASALQIKYLQNNIKLLQVL